MGYRFYTGEMENIKENYKSCISFRMLLSLLSDVQKDEAKLNIIDDNYRNYEILFIRIMIQTVMNHI